MVGGSVIQAQNYLSHTRPEPALPVEVDESTLYTFLRSALLLLDYSVIALCSRGVSPLEDAGFPIVM